MQETMKLLVNVIILAFQELRKEDTEDRKTAIRYVIVPIMLCVEYCVLVVVIFFLTPSPWDWIMVFISWWLVCQSVEYFHEEIGKALFFLVPAGILYTPVYLLLLFLRWVFPFGKGKITVDEVVL